MDLGRHSRPATGENINKRSAAIARLSASPRFDALSPLSKRAVLAFRIVAVCGRLKHDPVEELTNQLGSIGSAKSFDQFARVVSAFWPDRVRVMRPCGTLLSPDEWTLAQLLDAGRDDDRRGFTAAIEGFIRTERHDPLFEEARLVAQAMG
jgi:hypothetical protein